MSTTVAENDQQSQDKQEKAQKSRGRVKAVGGAIGGARFGGRHFGKAGAVIGGAGGALWGKKRGEGQGAKKEEQKQEQEKGTQDSRLKRHVTEGGKHLAKEALKQGARTLAKSLGPVSVVAVPLVEAVIHWRIIAYIAAGVVLFLLFLISSDGASNTALQQQLQQQQKQTQNTQPTVTETCVPATLAKIGETTTCTITVTYDGSADDIQVVDTIESLSGSSYVPGSSSPQAAFDVSTGTLLWDAKNLNLQLNPVNFKVSFKLVSTKDNWTIYNQYTITPTNLSSGSDSSIAGGGLPANANTCSGKYTANMSSNYLLKKNFGDPDCNMPDANAFATYLKQQDPANGAKWFLVAQCESGYNPNAWRDPNEIAHTPDASGAWGLFQIGSSAIMTPDSLYTSNRTATISTSNVQQQPGLPMPTWGHGGSYDRGDVDWKTQVQNAIQLLKSRGWGYWACS
jgi:hypothetical protein